MISLENIIKLSDTGLSNGNGYICSCKFGSPEPHHVVLVAKLHEWGCPIRQKILANEIEDRAVQLSLPSGLEDSRLNPYRQLGISGDTIAIWNDLRRVFRS